MMLFDHVLKAKSFMHVYMSETKSAILSDDNPTTKIEYETTVESL